MKNVRYLVIDKKDDVYLKIEAEDSIRRELGQHFTFEVPGFRFMPQFRNRVWDGKIRLFSYATGQIYVGLYPYILNWCKENEISMGVCTNKQEHLAIDLLKQIKVYDFFEYVAGSNTFDFCKPDPRHLTNVIEIMQGDIKKSIMIGDSETDGNAAKAAGIPFILLEDGYTEKNVNEISHNHLIRDFVGIEKIVQKYLHH